jgi:hypothetical protein
MKPCRECGREISEQAMACPNCGAPRPALEHWDGWGFEYRSKFNVLGMPLVHVSFKYRPNRMPVVARGIIAIGQFACGIVSIGQFGLGIVSISQFAVGLYVLAQIGAAYSLIAQIGVYLHDGRGQIVRSLLGLLGIGD